MTSRRLHVTIDGAAMGEEEARVFWARFSAYMDEHRGDLAGFAKSEGLASVHPRMSPDGALLVGSTSAAQESYAPATAERGGGSAPTQGPSKRRARRGH